MRISGHVIGARAITSVRRSVILRSDGLELVLTFCGCASRRESDQNAAPVAAPAARLRKERRPLVEENRLKGDCSADWLPHKTFFIISLLLYGQRRLHHGACVADIESVGRVAPAAGIAADPAALTVIV